MARRNRISETLKSIAGGIMVGFGLHILSANVDQAAAQLKHLVATPTGEALGVVPAAVLAASQAAHVYAFDHQGVLLGLFHLLVTFWPLVLVIIGTFLLQDVLRDKVKALPKPTKYFQNKDNGCRFCCPSFDV
ncbi:MAG: hypothetical protein ACRD20_05645 [Terriglobales bacterium]